MNGILEYLQAIESMSAEIGRKSIEGVVLRHGRSFQPPVNPRPAGIKKGRDRQCYMNSYRIASQMGWTYVEGFAISSDTIAIPVQHAWVVDDKGSVIETTWRRSGAEYYGIPLEFSFMHKVMLETKCYGILDARSKALRERFLA